MSTTTAPVAVSREEWRDRWLASKTSPRTRVTYGDGIGRWFEFCDRAGVDVWEAEAHHVDDYRNQLTGQPATVARHLATVSSFYRLVLRRGRPAPIVANPASDVERPRVDTVSRRAGLDAVQAKALRAAAVEHGPRTAALVHLLLGTAMRVSEAVTASTDGLGWTDAGERTLSVTRKGGVPDVVVFEPGDWTVIEHYLTDRPDVEGRWLFATTGGRRMSRQTAYRLVREVADPVVDGSKLIGPHSLRHTAATLALDANESVQEVQGMLRHSSAATTQRYDRRFRERGRSASRAVSRVLNDG